MPFVLRDAMLRLDPGGSRLYRRHLLDKLKASLRRKFAERPFPLAVDLDAIRDLNQFDDRITAPLNGFAGVFDYYTRASCRPFLADIHTPTLILQAADDPFMFPTTVPWAHELGPGVTLEPAAHGGKPRYKKNFQATATLAPIGFARPRCANVERGWKTPLDAWLGGTRSGATNRRAIRAL
ncbi:hypothetical protein Atep_09220 [Allochromatium tepidum]|uniref:Uncharacterized protein n=1 Tax=Allochromatium tepidum TaxID=553982 RepID=A0ABM7QKF5_9GAMM|nr:hypothetical protein Atep_09220 [Allochromatium tepidum]